MIAWHFVGEQLRDGSPIRSRLGRYLPRPITERWAEKIIGCPMSGCWLWTGSVDKDGYGLLHLQGHAHVYAHRVAWEITHGSIPDGMFVLHRCDVTCCVNPAHLFIGSHADNMKDKCVKGRARGGSNRGSSNGRAKLTEALVNSIRIDTRSQRAIAREYSVHQSTICDIKKGRLWKQ